MPSLFVKKIESVDCLSSSNTAPLASCQNDSGSPVLITGVYAVANDVSGVTHSPYIALSTANSLSNGNVDGNILPEGQIPNNLYDTPDAEVICNPKALGRACILEANTNVYVWVTRPAMAASYTIDFYVVGISI